MASSLFYHGVDGFFTIPGWKFHDRNSLETATRMDETESWGIRPNVRPNVQLFGSVPFRRLQAIYHPFFPQWLVTNQTPSGPSTGKPCRHLIYVVWSSIPPLESKHHWPNKNDENGMVDHLQEMNSSSPNCSYLFIMFFLNLRKALVVQVFPQDLPR